MVLPLRVRMISKAVEPQLRSMTKEEHPADGEMVKLFMLNGDRALM